MNKFLSILFLSLGTFVISCSDEDRVVYSCNPTEDEWVHDNLDEIRCMTRAQWNNLDENLKMPVFVAFSSEQRYQLWIGKLNDAIALDWSESEKAHIQEIIDFINENPDCFEEGGLNEDMEDKLELFDYQWTTFAKEEFGWDSKVIYGIIYTPNSLLDKEGNIAKSTTVSARIIRSEGTSNGATSENCNCRVGRNCEGTFECKESTTCDEVNRCGFLTMQRCNGRCGI